MTHPPIPWTLPTFQEDGGRIGCYPRELTLSTSPWQMPLPTQEVASSPLTVAHSWAALGLPSKQGAPSRQCPFQLCSSHRCILPRAHVCAAPLPLPTRSRLSPPVLQRPREDQAGGAIGFGRQRGSWGCRDSASKPQRCHREQCPPLTAPRASTGLSRPTGPAGSLGQLLDRLWARPARWAGLGRISGAEAPPLPGPPQLPSSRPWPLACTGGPAGPQGARPWSA